jgi:hypothetical protein
VLALRGLGALLLQPDGWRPLLRLRRVWLQGREGRGSDARRLLAFKRAREINIDKVVVGDRLYRAGLGPNFSIRRGEFLGVVAEVLLDPYTFTSGGKEWTQAQGYVLFESGRVEKFGAETIYRRASWPQIAAACERDDTREVVVKFLKAAGVWPAVEEVVNG